MTVESTNTYHAAGVSRRRIVQGAAWATPAVLLATSAPAGANNSPELGVPTFTGSKFEASSTVNSALTLIAANEAPTTGQSLSSVEVFITLPKAKVGALVSSTLNGWVLSGPVDSGTNWLYTATYAAAIAPATPSLALTAVFAPAGDTPYPVTATLTGSAKSGATATAEGATVNFAQKPLTRAGDPNVLNLSTKSFTQNSLKITLPADVTLAANSQLVVTWKAANNGNASVAAANYTQISDSKDSNKVHTTTLKASGTVSGSITLNFTGHVAIADADDVVVVLTGVPNGSTLERSVTIGGDFTA
ncbi:hypothetical protein [Demequina phytophila]|uniref:hypothetical protein n=1 Tax=Demequina phytophila TaxID=1638981 RepID=UPI0012E057E8|nr:hypothetical protein [Demequina phytophila]